MKLPVVESPEKKKRKTKDSPSPPSFSSLPDEITVNYLARIPRPYYPRLSIVSKSFRSILSSTDLYAARSHLGSTEQCLYVCFTDHIHRFSAQWFRLWVNPNRILASSSVIGRLVPIPPCNFPALERSTVVVGSEIYVMGGPTIGPPSSAVGVLDCLTNTWRDAPSMNVARENASSCFYHGKIYVLGGCKGLDESWAEVFDTKTQTWERLPNPSTDIHRFRVVRIAEMEGKVYVYEINFHTYVLKLGNWEFCEDHTSAMIPWSKCVIENVSYRILRSFDLGFTWYDIKDGIWKDVKGVDSLKDKYRMSARSGISMTRLVSCGGKILLIWGEHMPRKKMVSCAEIAVEKRDGGEVWGSVEWVDVVHTIPDTCYFSHCLVASI